MEDKKLCEYCKSEIHKKATICPICKKKQKYKSNTIKCPNCKEEIDYNFNMKICPKCGKSLKSIQKAGCLTAIVIVFVVIAIIIGLMVNVVNSGSVSKIENATSATYEDANSINDILESLGINKIENIELDEELGDYEGEGSKAYRIKTSFTDNVILYLSSENKVICVRWADKDFYRDGNVLLTFNDYFMTAEEESDYYIDAKKRVEAILKSPSTANFPSITKWKFSKDNGAVTVQSYVDSQNSYGAEIRAEFQLKYDSNKNLVSFIFDGEEYIK